LVDFFATPDGVFVFSILIVKVKNEAPACLNPNDLAPCIGEISPPFGTGEDIGQRSLAVGA
jgi:hypothetical protein